MLETERSSDEALRQPTFRRLYLGALQIDNPTRKLRACYIILLAGRVGLRTGEIQHVCEDWIDWQRGEIAIPRHHPCGCKNCWVRAIEKANRDSDTLREKLIDIFEEDVSDDADRTAEEIVDQLLQDDEALTEEIEEDVPVEQELAPSDDETDEDRTAEEILYDERWQPKYERSARRVPFGHSRRLTAVIHRFLKDEGHMEITQNSMLNHVEEAAEHAVGVDPDAITIRGLRATAATHYATYIRTPKVLQDLMGWTRIETAARYLRRSGATTTDIVYNAFDKGDLKPNMFPGGTETRYPLINDSRKYSRDGNPEPFEAFLWIKENRQAAGRNGFPDSVSLFHPREANPPDEYVYDPDKHTIFTHIDVDDLRSSTQATFAEVLENHPTKEQLEAEGEEVRDDEDDRVDEDEEDAKARLMRQMEVTSEEYQAQSLIYGLFVGILESLERVGYWLGGKLTKYISIDRPETKLKRIIVGTAGFTFIFAAGIYGFLEAGLLVTTSSPPYLALVRSWNVVFYWMVIGYAVYKIPGSESMSDIFRYRL